MESPIKADLANMRGGDRVQIEGLFASVNTYWLTAAVATAFALETLDVQEADGAARAVERFNAAFTVQTHEAEALYQEAKAHALANMEGIRAWNSQTCAFDVHKAVMLCAGFSTYWLFTKLIEVEWQKVLDAEHLVDTYQFLDGVIEDQQESRIIAEKIEQGKALVDDEVVYLRAHWEHARDFFQRLQTEMRLLDQGLVPYVQRSF